MIEPIDLGIPGLTNIERIGAGGNAIVYRARQGDLDRNVVVKVLLSVDAETTRRRFDRERRAMGRLSQAAGIAPLYGSGFTPQSQPYLLMPFYERGSLQEWIDSGITRDMSQMQDIGVTIAKAVHTAHENGVLHRDLKPANILMTRSGQPDVADFGIAHLVDDTLGTSQALTMTPLYTAPEVFDGVDSGVASDIYSLGATMFALLNGRPAFSDPSGSAPMLSLMRRIHEDPLPALPATVPKGIAAAITKAMSKDPADRQATAAELAADLAAADLAALPKKPRSARSSSSRSPVLAVVALLVLVVAIGGALLASQMLGGGDELGQDSDPVPDVETPVTVGPTPLTLEPTPTAAEVTPDPFDVAQAQTAAQKALVRVEAFSCTGALVTTGVVVNDGLVVTSEAVLSSPWHIEVSVDGQTRSALPQTSDRNRALSLILVQDDSIFDVLVGAEVEPGDLVGIVGIDGQVTIAEIETDATNSSFLTAIETETGAFDDVESGDVIVTDAGAFVGVARPNGGVVDVLTIARIEEGWNRIPPSYSCPAPERTLGPTDVESAVAPAIGELLTMQQLSDAYANEQWARVRQLEPSKTAYSEQQFIAGWRPLRQGFVYPVERTLTDDDDALWRIGLIGHETWSGTDLTTLFCVTWSVERVSGNVVQTNQDNVIVYGSQPGQPQRTGFVDPADLRALINQNC